MAGSSSGVVEDHPCYMVELGSYSQMYPNSMEFVIGRGKYSDLQISSSQVSRKHCEILSLHHGWKIRNKSTNGTWLNGIMLTHSDAVNLNNTDIVMLGDIYIQCFLSVDNERFHRPIKILKIIALVGADQCTLSSGQETESQSEKSIEKNSDVLDHDAVLKIGNEINCAETNLMEKSTEKSQQEVVAGKTKESILMEQLESLRKNNLMLMKELENSNIAIKQAVTAKEETCLELSQLKQDMSHSLLPKIEGLIETELQCSICHEVIINATTPNCSHTFCEYCLLEWTKKNNICPICRTTITCHNRTKMIDNFIEKILLNLPVEIQERRKELVESRIELTKKVLEKSKPRKRRRISRSASSGGRQAITIALQNLANLMDTTIDISSDDESPVFLFQQRLRP